MVCEGSSSEAMMKAVDSKTKSGTAPVLVSLEVSRGGNLGMSIPNATAAGYVFDVLYMIGRCPKSPVAARTLQIEDVVSTR